MIQSARNRARMRMATKSVAAARSALRAAAAELVATEDEDAFLASEMLLDLEVKIGNVQNNEMPEPW